MQKGQKLTRVVLVPCAFHPLGRGEAVHVLVELRLLFSVAGMTQRVTSLDGRSLAGSRAPRRALQGPNQARINRKNELTEGKMHTVRRWEQRSCLSFVCQLSVVNMTIITHMRATLPSGMPS